MINRKLLISFLILILIFPTIVLADDISDEDLLEFNISDTYETTNSATNEPITYSKNIVSIDRKTLSVLYEKDAYTEVPMASTTKIMTCILALENASLTDTVTISKNASHVTGSTLGVKENMQFSMNDLLYGLMMRSRK